MGGWERKVGVEHCGKAWLGVRRVDECGRVGQVMSEWVTVCGRGRYQSEWAGGRHGLKVCVHVGRGRGGGAGA